MNGGCLLFTALWAAPTVGFQAGLVATGAGGLTPVQPGETATEAFSVEVIPSAGMVVTGGQTNFGILYSPRIFYRGFLGDPAGQVPLDRPLLQHNGSITFDQPLTRTWNLNVTGSASVGEVDFQNAAFLGGDGDDGNAAPGQVDGPTPVVNAQAVEALNVSGGIGVSGALSTRWNWSNAVAGNYTRPISDESSDAQVGLVPEQGVGSYITQFAYAISREHRITFGGNYSYSVFNTEPLTGDVAMAETQLSAVHAGALQVGYGWNFARNSNLSFSGGLQLAYVQSTVTADDGTEVTERTLEELPTVNISFSWLPINERKVRVSNRFAASIDGFQDPIVGVYQSRLNLQLDFQLDFPPDLTVGLSGSLTMPLTEPSGQARQDDDTGDDTQLFAAGNSQVSVSIPITYRFTDNLSGTIGAQFGYLFDLFAPDRPPLTDPTVDDDGVDGSINAQLFVTLAFNLSTLRDRRGQQQTQSTTAVSQ